MPDHSLTPLILQLFKNGIRYRYLKLTGTPAKPHAVSFEITRQCIAKCIMCNIWKTSREVADLPIEDWSHLFSSPFFSDLRELDVTGGEPYLRQDLLEFIERVSHLKDENLKAMRSVAITTNGFLTLRILEYTPKMLELLSPRKVDLVIVCAMDGIGEPHDRIRNYKDAWTRVNNTIQGLKKIRRSTPNLVIGLKTTVLPQNVNQLEKIAKYADGNELFTIISPCIITENRYHNIDRREDLVFDERDIEEMIKFYKLDQFHWNFHRNRLVDYLRTGVMKKPCTAGFNYFFVRSNGEVFPCPLIKIRLGNFKETKIEELFFSEEALQFRRQVGKYTECQTCTEPGLERYALPFEGFSYLSLMLKIGKKGFLDFHKHMGLDKYFS